MNRSFSQFKATREVGTYSTEPEGVFCYQTHGLITGWAYKRDFTVFVNVVNC